MMINHELLKTLTYQGPYGARYTCKECKHRAIGDAYQPCTIQGVEVSHANNVCRFYEARITNPTCPPFCLEDYLEYLMSDFYRPWSVDTSIIIGSAKLGEAHADEGKLADLLPNTYSYMYQPYDQPYCRVRFPSCHVKVGEHRFEVDYKRYREGHTVENGALPFSLHLWKDKPNQKKYQREAYGTWKLE